jgi:hypothetical protein
MENPRGERGGRERNRENSIPNPLLSLSLGFRLFLSPFFRGGASLRMN